MPEPDRGAGGYYTADSVRATEREIILILSPAAATASAAVEQTFTVPGLLVTDRIQSFAPTTSPFSGTSALGISFRASAISIISVAFVNAGTSAGQPTTSARYAVSFKAWRLGSQNVPV